MKEKNNLIEFTKSFVELKVSLQNISHTLQKMEDEEILKFETMFPFSFKTRNLETNEYETTIEKMIVSGEFNSSTETVKYKKFTLPKKFEQEFMIGLEGSIDIKLLQENLLSEFNEEITRGLINQFKESMKVIKREIVSVIEEKSNKQTFENEIEIIDKKISELRVENKELELDFSYEEEETEKSDLAYKKYNENTEQTLSLYDKKRELQSKIKILDALKKMATDTMNTEVKGEDLKLLLEIDKDNNVLQLMKKSESDNFRKWIDFMGIVDIEKGFDEEDLLKLTEDIYSDYSNDLINRERELLDFNEIFEMELEERKYTLSNLSKEIQTEFEDWIEEKESILISNFDSSMEEETETKMSKARLEVMIHTYYLIGEKEFLKQLEELSELERSSIYKEVMNIVNKTKIQEQGMEKMKTLSLNNKTYTATNKKIVEKIEKSGFDKKLIQQLTKEGKIQQQNEDKSFVSGTNNIISFKTSDRNLISKTIQENESVKYIIDSHYKKTYNLSIEQDIQDFEKIIEQNGVETNIDFEKGTYQVQLEEKGKETKEATEFWDEIAEEKEKSNLNKTPNEEQKKKYKEVQDSKLNKEERVDLIKDELERMLSKTSEEETQSELLKFFSHVSKFNNFSTLNVMKLMTQAREQGNMDISYVQSAKKWQEEGVIMKKGTKAMKVSAPKQMYKIERDNEGKPIKIGKGYKYLLDENGKRIKDNMTFIDVPVFDASQTNAEELGKLPDLGYRNKKANISNEMLDEIMNEVSSKYGVSIREKNLNQPNLGGYYQKEIKEIVINTGGIREDGQNVKSNSQMLSTLFHELGHHLLHGNENYEAIHMDKSQKEGEAESVSYILSSHVGIEQNSHLYIKGWDKDLDSMKDSINKITKESRGVMNKIDFEKILKDEEQRQIKILEELKLKKEQELENEENMDSDYENEYSEEEDCSMSM